MKLFIIFILLVILYCLASGLYHLLTQKQAKMASALTWRIALSICLFFLLFIAYGFGLIMPHGMVS